MAKIKDFFHRLYLKISFSKFVKWLFPIFLICFIPNVFATDYLPGQNFWFNLGSDIVIDGDSNDIPYNSNVPANFLGSQKALNVSFSPASSNISALEQPTFNYLYFNLCATGQLRFEISNSSTQFSYFVGGNNYAYNLNRSCSFSGRTGQVYVMQMQVGKWNLNEYSELFEVDSYFQWQNSSANTIYFRITKIFLSTDDLISEYRDRDTLYQYINNIGTDISSASTNIQNSISTASNQAHTDSTNIKNSVDSIRNQDTSYNNNASDNLNGQSQLNSYDTKTNFLIDLF